MIRDAIRVSAIALGLLTTTAAHAENVGILQATLAEANQKTAEVSTEQLRRILADGSEIVLDARTRDEFDAGHIPGARHLDAPAAGQIAAVERAVAGNKDAALVLYYNGPFCRASRRLAEQLVAEGFRNVRRYQLGIPVWRALGGPTAINAGGITRVFGIDRTAVFIDARAASEFANGSVPSAQNAPLGDVISGKAEISQPEDDFNRRIILFGRDATRRGNSRTCSASVHGTTCLTSPGLSMRQGPSWPANRNQNFSHPIVGWRRSVDGTRLQGRRTASIPSPSMGIVAVPAGHQMSADRSLAALTARPR